MKDDEINELNKIWETKQKNTNKVKPKASDFDTSHNFGCSHNVICKHPDDDQDDTDTP